MGWSDTSIRKVLAALAAMLWAACAALWFAGARGTFAANGLFLALGFVAILVGLWQAFWHRPKDA
jgi:hypothetical protein